MLLFAELRDFSLSKQFKESLGPTLQHRNEKQRLSLFLSDSKTDGA
jgi:hypothetical protein